MRYATGRISPIATTLRYPRWAMTISAQVHSDPTSFRLVIIEAMSAGTPIVAWRNGSVPEVITDHVSGVIVDSYRSLLARSSRTEPMEFCSCATESHDCLRYPVRWPVHDLPLDFGESVSSGGCGITWNLTGADTACRAASIICLRNQHFS
jgi:hypothetical protein